MGWVDALRDKVVGLDTTPLIYFTKQNLEYIEIVRPFFQGISNKEFEVVTSMVTLLEVLVIPNLKVLKLKEIIKTSQKKQIGSDHLEENQE